MAENWKSCFEEELICPICLHVFVEPVQLPCKHNFCRGCIGEAWAKEAGLVRCPECNQAYNQKPSLEKNLKLTNIVEKFNSLGVEKAPSSVLHCVFCRRGPPLPAQKVCLRCEAPCCQSHVQTHLQQPSTARGHLLVEAEDVRAWSCPQHNAYRLYHCEAEQVAVCHYCCYYSGAHQGHSICDVEIRRNEIRQLLMKQQDRLEEREHDIENQIYKLESDKRLVEEKVHQLKDEVRLQYEKMHQLLDEDLGKTLEILDKARAKFCDENSAQVLQLNEFMQEAKKLLSSIQVMFDKTDDINFMKNTKSVKILTDRTQNYTGNGLPPPKIGHLNSKLFLNEIAKKEKQLRKMLEGPFSTSVPFLQTFPVYHCNISSSGAEKRKHSTAFPEASFLEPPSAGQYLGQGSSAGEGQSAQPMVPCSSTQHIVGLPSGPPPPPQPVHSGAVFNSSHYANSSAPQQQMISQYGGRKILVCSVDNCYCSGMPSVSNHSGQPYPRPGHFPWTVPSQDYTHPLPPTPAPVPQSLPGLAMREWIDASQPHGRQDFYRVYGQPSTKHYVAS
ncbi:E3 ubiquitin-protein ligase TRIM8b [Latimeria chalumnae]|uniref:E3 ubiquitin-protein ligase TRIM8 n=1 Tax=Latimeria chalumnae TaxID=7897 RepID=H3AFM4_LATCH|nr:PREDICTED: probable E3 ubiquitin-protein ligase TRIM8 [Latimeria chalumnae]|eukprot:XP_006007437.1 PREDICTED: probable E3 ubiquitin-protein ligase TRIM8 [Latimeria chalumnae]